MAKVQLRNLGDELERRVIERLKRLNPNSLELREALLRIGIMLETEIKFNIRRKQIVDTGRLLNSIKHELYIKGTTAGVQVGAFGVPYAAQHEFGGPFTDHQRRAMFASLRRTGKLQRQKANKGVIRGNTFAARPFMRPAVRVLQPRIIDILRSYVRGNG